MASNPFNKQDFAMGYGDLTTSTTAAPAAQDGAWNGGAADADANDEVNLAGEGGGAFDSAPVAAAPAGELPKDAKKREKALAKREKELAKREEQLVKREAALAASGAAAAIETKNWPSCYPLIHHDIDSDIPTDFKRAVKVGWITLWAFVVASIVNWVGALVALATIGTKDGRLPGFFLALIYLVAGVPLVYVLWYRTLYKSAMTDRALGFAWFFVTFAAWMVFVVWSAVGPDILVSQWSHTGVLSTISAFDKNVAAGIVYLIGTVFWCLTALLGVVLLKMVYMRFRGRGQTGGTLQAEMMATMATRSMNQRV